MSNLQRRAKNGYKVPSLNMTESKMDTPFNDPRSPSANVSRTPVDLYTYHLPNAPAMNITQVKSTR